MKYILLIVFIIFICFSCAITGQENWLEFDIPDDIQRLYDSGNLSTVEKINKFVWDSYDYENYTRTKKNPKGVLQTKTGNCVDLNKLSVGLSYKLLNIQVDMAIVSKEKYWDHATLYYKNKPYCRGKRNYHIEKIVLFDYIPYEIF